MRCDWVGYERLCAMRRIQSAWRSKYNRRRLMDIILDEADGFKLACKALPPGRKREEKRTLAWYFLDNCEQIARDIECVSPSTLTQL